MNKQYQSNMSSLGNSDRTVADDNVAASFAETGHSNRRIDRLLAEYGESHQNFVNKLVHWFAVPVIAWCVLALLWVTPFPTAWQLGAFEFLGGLNWAWVVAALATLYYLTLSIPLALGMAGFVAACFSLIVAYLNWGDLPLWQFAIALFLGAWVFQFIGHKIEGRSPSFFKDLQFLLIGPAWLMSFLFRLFRVRY